MRGKRWGVRGEELEVRRADDKQGIIQHYFPEQSGLQFHPKHCRHPLPAPKTLTPNLCFSPVLEHCVMKTKESLPNEVIQWRSGWANNPSPQPNVPSAPKVTRCSNVLWLFDGGSNNGEEKKNDLNK